MDNVLIIAVYVASGVLQPLLIEILNYQGACEQSTMLIVLPLYLGMTFSVFLPDLKSSPEIPKLTSTSFPDSSLPSSSYKMFNLHLITRNNVSFIFFLCLFDISAQCFNLSGLMLTGSLIFTILYSSCTLWTAIFSKFILGRTLHIFQWLFILLIVFGLATSVIGSKFEEGSNVLVGSFMIFFGTILHAFTFIMSEEIMTRNNDFEERINPKALCTIIGLFGSFVIVSWQFIYTFPRFSELVLDQIVSHNGNINLIIATFVVLTSTNLIHSFCFFHLVESVGATTTGVVKGIQSVFVFVLSHVCFCSIQLSQCFSKGKAMALVFVVFGVVGYSYFANANRNFHRNNFSTNYSDAHYTEITN